MQLATFLHISDLHFGLRIDSQGNTLVPPLLPWFFHRRHPGYLGHEFRSLLSIEKLWNNLQRQENARLIVTGDLTATGHPTEFNRARDFVGAALNLVSGSKIGLFETSWSNRTIPGNHDHWPGSTQILGPPTIGLSNTFPSIPFISTPLRLPTGHVLQFMGIDTDADIHPYGTNRLLARGSFYSQLITLQNQLNLHSLNNPEIRILLLHHSYTWKSFLSGIDSSSRRELTDFIVRNNISVLLSGHIHEPFIDLVMIGGHEILSATCGTSSQRNFPPSSQHKPIKRNCPNTVLVHRLFSEDSKIIWSVETLVQTPRGFIRPTQLTNHLHQQFVVLP